MIARYPREGDNGQNRLSSHDSNRGLSDVFSIKWWKSRGLYEGGVVFTKSNLRKWSEAGKRFCPKSCNNLENVPKPFFRFFFANKRPRGFP
jgi:hypothetical protein